MSLNIEWLEPWEPLEDDFDPSDFLAELRRELAPGHPLARKNIIPRATRGDCDDWLVELPGHEPRWAVVHPTFSGKQESTIDFPGTAFYSTFAEWVEKCMEPEHAEWVEIMKDE